MAAKTPRFLTYIGFLLAFFWGVCPAIAQPVPADTPLTAIAQVTQGLAAERKALEESNVSARQNLRNDERTLKPKDVTPARLEEARLDVSAAHAQLDSIASRLRSRRDTINNLQREINALRIDTQTPAKNPAENSADNAEQQPSGVALLATKQKMLEASQALVNELERLRDATHQQQRLAQRRLALLQQRFDLNELRPARRGAAQRAALQQAVDRYIREASQLRREIRNLDVESVAGAAQKRLLEVRAFDATERAELKSTALVLLDYGRSVNQLAGLSDNRAMPERALVDARARLANIDQELSVLKASLSRKLEVIEEQQRIVEQRGSIAAFDAAPGDAPGETGNNSTVAQQKAVLEALGEVVAAQNGRVASLSATAERADKRFVSAIGRASRSELITRRSLPDDALAWRNVGGDLASLPGRILGNLWAAAQAVWQRITHASLWQLGVLLVLEGALVAAILWLRRFLDRSLIQKDLDRGATLPMCALYWSLPALIPAAMLSLLGVVLSVSNVNIILLLTLLLIWPGVKFMLKMSYYLLVDEAPSESVAIRTRLYRELQWVLSLVGLIIGLSVVARVVALSPSVVDLLERFTMVCLLLVALPALHVRQVILARSDQDMKEAGFWIRFAAALSLLAPVALIGCALLGLIGYVPLAWTITTHLGWIALVLAAWLLAESSLRDGVQALGKRVQAGAGESADFWNQNIINPLYKLTALALAGLAGFILFQIFGWTAETPVIRWVPQLLRTELFSLGQTTLHVRELLVAVLVVVGVFWMGSWSKQVSFKFAYAKIGDYGIRQSLSTFTQYAVVVLGLYVALKTIGLDLTALTVFAGALGVGIGFGLQNITSNFISGILLLIERPLRVTDIVNVEGIDGTVTHIGIRAIKVRTFEQQEVVVPNSSIITKPFTNWTGGDDIYRTMFYVRVSYDCDPHEAIDIISQIVNAHEAVVKTPAAKVVLNDFTESCMLIRVQYFTHVLGDTGLLDVRSQILFAIWDAFRQAGIKIPFPQQDVHLKQLPNASPESTENGVQPMPT